MAAEQNGLSIPAAPPVQLQPVFRTNNVNESISLYRGPLTLKTNDRVEDGTGSIKLEWLPVPRFVFRWESAPVSMSVPEVLEEWRAGKSELTAASLRLENGRELGVEVMGLGPRRSDVRQPTTKWGYVTPSVLGCGEKLKTVFFHLPNFHKCHGSFVRTKTGHRCRDARAVMEAEGWRVTLDDIGHESNDDAQAFGKQIEAVGGFGLTHVGRIERCTGDCFRPRDLQEVLEPLSWFLSFCRGNWVAPLLCVGFDADGKRSWEEWREWKVGRWQRVGSWFDTDSCVGLVKAFPGFVRRWKDKRWNEAVRLSLHWYAESNLCAGGVEGGTILSQAAFELLAWTLLVEDRKVLSKDGFARLPASDKLRLLLSSCGIPREIPKSFGELWKAANEWGCQDGPQAITEVRNALMHPSPEKRKKVLGAATDARGEAWLLGLWYLELVLLWLFDYHGKYSNRLVREGLKWQQVEPAPWSS